MPLPEPPIRWKQALDPSEILDYVMELGVEENGRRPLLDVDNGEEIASYDLNLTADAASVGLLIGTGAYAHALVADNTAVKLWLSVDPAKRSDCVFSHGGVEVGVIGTFVTNSSPARTFERTWMVRVRQR